MNRLAVPCIFMALLAAGAAAQEAPAITPYRPSVSSPAQLPAAGQLEFEGGLLAVRDHGARRDSVPLLFKLAFSDQWGVLLGADAYVAARDEDGALLRGFGDTTVVLKRAFALEPGSALGVELSAKAPTAKRGIGSGKSDVEVNTIYSQDIAKVHMDANANLTRLGAWEEGSGRYQTGLSASFSVPVGAEWGATAELSGTRRSAVPSTAQLLVAAAYSPSPRLTFDVGVAHGLNAGTPAWSLFSGVVLPLAKLW
jgi:hypothetical protein